MTRQKLFKLLAVALLLINVSADTFGKWTSLTPVPTKGRWGAMTFVLDNKIFIGGGYVGDFQNLNDLLVYDIAGDTWGYLTGLPSSAGTRTAGVSFVIDGKAYLGLGAENYNNFNPQPSYLADLWEYDAGADKWSAKANFPSAGVSDAAVFVIDGKAYIVGGELGSTQSDKTYEYDPATDTWTEKAAYPGGGIRMGTGLAIGGKGYVVGGEISGDPTNKVYEYDPSTDKWSTKKTYPTPIWSAVAVVVNGKAYVGLGAENKIGGSTSTKYSNQFFEYNPELNEWAYWGGAELDNGRMHSMAAVDGGKAYIGNGWKLDGIGQLFYNDWFSLDPASIVGIAETNKKDLIKIFPNPASDKVYVSSKAHNMSYEIYNITGKLAQKGVLNIDNKEINLSTMPAGNYILKLTSEEFAVSKILTKE